MIAIGEKYDELEFIKFGEMLLVNPNEKLEQAHFFIKEKNVKINELYFILNLCAKFSLKSQPSIYGKYGKWIL